MADFFVPPGRGACRFHPGAVILSVLLPSALLTAQAAPSEEVSSLDDRIALSGHSLQSRSQAQASPRVTMTQNAAEPLATANQPAAVGNWYGRSATATQTMLWAQPWAGTGSLRLGLGVEQRGPAIGAMQQNPYQNWRAGASGDAGVLVGVAMPMGPRSHMFVQTPLLNAQRSPYDDFNLANRDDRQVRVGMVFNSRKKYADLRKGLRMELSGQSSLTFRPRGGRVGVTFQKTW